jgi:hypothetical protein
MAGRDRSGTESTWAGKDFIAKSMARAPWFELHHTSRDEVWARDVPGSPGDAIQSHSSAPLAPLAPLWLSSLTPLENMQWKMPSSRDRSTNAIALGKMVTQDQEEQRY